MIPEARSLSILDAVKAAWTVYRGRPVPESIVRERFRICGACEHVRQEPGSGETFCGICRCNVNPDAARIFNLAAIAEDLPRSGCKHPERIFGKGWLR
jgi:hypothetical protein